MKTQTNTPEGFEAFPAKIKLAIFAFIIAKLSGIASMMSLFAGLRFPSKVFLFTAFISLLFSVLIAMIKSSDDAEEQAQQKEIEIVKNLIKSGKLDSLIKEIKNEQT
jgi:hypothetical protein